MTKRSNHSGFKWERSCGKVDVQHFAVAIGIKAIRSRDRNIRERVLIVVPTAFQLNRAFMPKFQAVVSKIANRLER